MLDVRVAVRVAVRLATALRLSYHSLLAGTLGLLSHNSLLSGTLGLFSHNGLLSGLLRTLPVKTRLQTLPICRCGVLTLHGRYR